MATRIGANTRKRQDSAVATKHVTIPQWRITALLIVCLIIAGRVVLRLGEVQVIRGEEFAEQASREINQQITLYPSRGLITDRHGNPLSMDVERESLWVVPALIPADQAPKLALTLAALLGMDEQAIMTVLTDVDHYWLPLARWLDPEVAERITALEEPGLQMRYEPRRVYPQGTFAAHTIGAANFNGDGISGVESFYNTQLKGITGTLKAEFDPVRNPIAIAPQETEPARNGVNIRLTLDPMVQYIIEEELKQGIKDTQADSGTIIVIEPSTGAIRGMASWPTFDPNRYNDYAPELYGRNPAVNDLYEPGSIFKIITVASGLEVGAFTADTQVNDTGIINRYGDEFHNWNKLGNGVLDPDRVLYFSSNVGSILLNEMTGPEDFYEMVARFGFGTPTGVELGGEEAGIVQSPTSPAYNDARFLTNAYGQGISVTPLQMVSAMSAIANDGTLMKPYVVDQICEGENCTVTEPTTVRQVIDPGVAWTVRRMLVNAANSYAHIVWRQHTSSYGDQWLVPGFQVAAKTGTASIPISGGIYDPNFTIGSVLGVAPADDAHYAVLVKLDRPKGDIWAVSSVLPVYQRVVDQLLRYTGIEPDPSLFTPGQTR